MHRARFDARPFTGSARSTIAKSSAVDLAQHLVDEVAWLVPLHGMPGLERGCAAGCRVDSAEVDVSNLLMVKRGWVVWSRGEVVGVFIPGERDKVDCIRDFTNQALLRVAKNR